VTRYCVVFTLRLDFCISCLLRNLLLARILLQNFPHAFIFIVLSICNKNTDLSTGIMLRILTYCSFVILRLIHCQVSDITSPSFNGKAASIVSLLQSDCTFLTAARGLLMLHCSFYSKIFVLSLLHTGRSFVVKFM
jgi:hypothetical protein